MTTENYPSVAYQPYAVNSLAIIYFIIGILMFTLQKDFLLGEVAKSFTTQLEDQVREAYSEELRGYALAFYTITTYRRFVKEGRPMLLAGSGYGATDISKRADLEAGTPA